MTFLDFGRDWRGAERLGLAGARTNGTPAKPDPQANAWGDQPKKSGKVMNASGALLGDVFLLGVDDEHL